jgi:hypothetical protein
VLGAAFIALAVFQFVTAQIVAQGGAITAAVCQLLPAAAIGAAVVGMSAPRLRRAYHALWVSAAARTAWLAGSFVASSGA